MSSAHSNHINRWENSPALDAGMNRADLHQDSCRLLLMTEYLFSHLPVPSRHQEATGYNEPVALQLRFLLNSPALNFFA